jgi:A/G-specific adenine glycosylase
VTIASAELQDMQGAVLDWYGSHARDLAFRRTADPWSVLVSEVIAQQTQAARAAEAWTRLIAAYPTPAVLAAASPAEVIRAWRGLGYNRRALALRAAAVRIMELHGGRVPEAFEDLVALPGIGPYTARAVMAIAFNRQVAALDTNIRRVLGRAFGGNELAARRREFQAMADRFVPAGRAAAWTHALMDVGAAFCRKRNPRCEVCPLAFGCRYRLAGGAPASSAAPPRGRATTTPFPLTSRWLRGRILDQLRDAPNDAWVWFGAALGEHHVDRVTDELANLAREGMLELDPAGSRARLRTTT